MILVAPILKLIARIATLVLYAATAAACFGGYISPKISSLGSVMAIAMPYLVGASAIVVIAWFCTGHWIVGSLGVMTFIICGAPIRSWFPMHSQQKETPGAQTFTLLTWNTLHFANLEDPGSGRCRTLEEILRIDADIVCLQEIFGFKKNYMRTYDSALVDSLLTRYPYQLGDGTYDLRILSKYPLRHIYFGQAYHYTLAEYFTVKINGREIGMANVHLPSFALDEDEKGIFSPRTSEGIRQREELGKKILRKLQYAIPIRANAAEKLITGFESLKMPVIVAGDFNDVPASWTYRLFTKAGFKDAYVETNFWPTYTFYPHGLYFHLDQIFYRGNVRPLSVVRQDIRTSDHLPLLATFEIMNDPYPY